MLELNIFSWYYYFDYKVNKLVSIKQFECQIIIHKCDNFTYCTFFMPLLVNRDIIL